MRGANDATAEAVYRTAGAWRAFILLVGALLAVGGMAGIVYFGLGHEVSGPGDLWLMVGVCATLALLGVFVLASVLHDRLVLGVDYIESRELVRTRRLRFADVEGYRMSQANGVDILTLVPRAGAGRRMNITLTYALDERFRRWLNSQVNLDAQEAEAALKEIGANTLLGYSRAEREQRLAKARQVAGVLSAIALGVTVWAILNPEPYQTVLLAAAVLPWIAIALAWTDPAYTLRDTRNGEVHASLFFVVLMPGMALVVRALSDVQLADATPAAIAAAVGGALLALICGAHRKGALVFVFYAALLAAYPGGVLPLANALLDHADPRLETVVVQSKRITSGKTTTYYAGIQPAAPDGEDEVTVSPELYRDLAPGTTACLALYPGALKMAWFTLDRASACAAAQPAAR